MTTHPRFLDVHGDTSRPRGLSFQQYRVALFLRILATFFGLFLILGVVKIYFIIQSGNEVWIESTKRFRAVPVTGDVPFRFGSCIFERS